MRGRFSRAVTRASLKGLPAAYVLYQNVESQTGRRYTRPRGPYRSAPHCCSEVMMHRTRILIAVFALFFALSARTAYAQIDFSGEWAPRFYEDQPERVPGPELFDYTGIPVSESARQRASAWEASIQTLPEWQCRPHSADYPWRGPSQLRVSKEVDLNSREITAFHAEWLRSVDRAVYLD